MESASDLHTYTIGYNPIGPCAKQKNRDLIRIDGGIV